MRLEEASRLADNVPPDRYAFWETHLCSLLVNQQATTRRPSWPWGTCFCNEDDVQLEEAGRLVEDAAPDLCDCITSARWPS